MQEFDNTELVSAIQLHGIVRAAPGTEFELASGAKSTFYIDFSKIVMVPFGAAVVAKSIMDNLPRRNFDAIGGPMSGADPIVGALLMLLQRVRPSFLNIDKLRGFTIRKEPKGRGPGAGEMYEGYLEAGDKVVLVEDVTTSGGSVLKAIKAVEDRGASVIKIITLLDRMAGAAEKLKDYDFVALSNLHDLKIIG